ncbi:MAG: type VI secretion system contractile sheath large subunit, partial [Planctomycetaceae bacterium]
MSAEITSSAGSRDCQRYDSLLDSVLELEGSPPEAQQSQAAPPVVGNHAGERLAAFLSHPSDARSLALWFGDSLPPIPERLRSRLIDHVRHQPAGQSVPTQELTHLPLFQRLELRLQLSQLSADGIEHVARRLSQAIARIDGLISDQVNATIHHPRFQQLEASWRGIRYLTEQVEDVQRVRIRVLNLTWKELSRDIERAIDFDQSVLFRKV